jgi:hypothetical protein
MPLVEVGETVLWYPDGGISDGEVPSPGMVTGVSERTISVSVFEKDAVNVNPHDGVRHVRDPELSKFDVRISGAWDYGPMRKMHRMAKSAETVGAK